MSYLAANRLPYTRLLDEDPYIGIDPKNPGRPYATGRPLQFLIDQLLEARLHFHFPLSRQRQGVVERFRELVQRWQVDVGPVSSATEISMHPAYQQIIGLGPEVVPLILQELERTPDHWFWALKAITGIDPVEPNKRGRIDEMAEAWIRWGQEQGLV